MSTGHQSEQSNTYYSETRFYVENLFLRNDQLLRTTTTAAPFVREIGTSFEALRKKEKRHPYEFLTLMHTFLRRCPIVARAKKKRKICKAKKRGGGGARFGVSRFGIITRESSAMQTMSTPPVRVACEPSRRRAETSRAAHK